MELVYLDYLLILAYLLLLAFIIFRYAAGEKKFPDFFNAGGNLHWIWIAVSLLGTNIQIEYILASAANGFTHGLAFGSFEWIGSFVLIGTALYIVPFFLRAGVLTLPEYLEYRYDKNLRRIYAGLFIIVNLLMIILILNVSAIFIEKLFDIKRELTIVTVPVIGGMIIYAGGLKVKLRLDLIVISFFLIAGIALSVFCFIKTGGIKNFFDHADGKLAGIYPMENKDLPWTGVFLGGLWLTCTFYFAFFPPIAQGFLASNSLSEAQKGLLFTATVKLLLPFIMILPGIVGYELFSDQITHPDFTLPVVIKNVVPIGLQGLILAGYIGTLFTTYNSFLNSTSTIFTLDILGITKKLHKEGIDLVGISRKFIPVFVGLSVIIGIIFKPTDVIFHYSQLLIAAVAPLVTAIFLFALFSRKTPTFAAYICTLVGFPLFFGLKMLLESGSIKWLPSISLLNLSGIVFLMLFGLMGILRIAFPLKERVVVPERIKVKFERNLAVVIWSIFILTLIISIYSILIN